MVFCNKGSDFDGKCGVKVTILILIDGFLQYGFRRSGNYLVDDVTILILIDGFLQLLLGAKILLIFKSHNPYFNRWFSAIS